MSYEEELKNKQFNQILNVLNITGRIDLIKKSFNENIEKGGKPASIGEIRVYGGRKYKKESDGTWKPYNEIKISHRETDKEFGEGGAFDKFDYKGVANKIEDLLEKNGVDFDIDKNLRFDSYDNQHKLELKGTYKGKNLKIVANFDQSGDRLYGKLIDPNLPDDLNYIRGDIYNIMLDAYKDGDFYSVSMYPVGKDSGYEMAKCGVQTSATIAKNVINNSGVSRKRKEELFDLVDDNVVIEPSKRKGYLGMDWFNMSLLADQPDGKKILEGSEYPCFKRFKND
jgi:hypothetical protein